MTIHELAVDNREISGARSLADDLDWLGHIIRQRLASHFRQDEAGLGGDVPQPPSHENRSNRYVEFLERYQPTETERVVLLLALAPHARPCLLDDLIAEALPQGGDFPQFGGVRGQSFRGFLPTGETVLFLLAGLDPDRRTEMQQIFSEEHWFAATRVVRLMPPTSGEPAMSGRLVADPEFVDLVMLGKVARPPLSIEFPAKRITTEMDWEDLVLPAATLGQIEELKSWVNHGDTLLHDWGMKKKIRPGYRALFTGPPGTGKTLTATLLGKYTKRDVYRIDLAMIVSKFIGETEKNLASLFDKAENKDWILFFDEADALFGKRTSVRDAHDRYANQEIAYLLQRVEDYAGLVILASNFKNNIDDAFLRRFQSEVYFPVPSSGDRLKLWKLAFPPAVNLAGDVDLDVLSRRYELTGAHIMNAVQYACLRSLERGDNEIGSNDLIRGIRREISKEGKVQ